MSLILIRYGELALKSQKVRRRFEEHLIEGVSRQFERYGIDWIIERERGRIFLHTSEKNIGRAIFQLRHIPGIFSVSPVRDFEITHGMETIISKAGEFAGDHLSPGQSFAVRVRRAGSHAFTSQEAAALAGERILEMIPGLKVKLKEPDVTIHLEIRGRRGFLFTESFRGMGGLPPGSQGKVVLLLSGQNSMAAGYLLMKRGCIVIPIHFCGFPDTSLDRNDNSSRPEDEPPSTRESRKAFKRLSRFDPRMEFIQFENELDPSMIEHVMREKHAQAVVTGVRFPEFQSLFQVKKEPVFYPLIGLPDEDIKVIIDRIEDYHQFISNQETKKEETRKEKEEKVPGETETEKVTGEAGGEKVTGEAGGEKENKEETKKEKEAKKEKETKKEMEVKKEKETKKEMEVKREMEAKKEKETKKEKEAMEKKVEPSHERDQIFIPGRGGADPGD